MCCFLLCLAFALAKDEEVSSTAGQNTGKFVPTNEWQTIPEGMCLTIFYGYSRVYYEYYE